MKNTQKTLRAVFYIYTVATLVGCIVFPLAPLGYLLGGSSWVAGLCALAEDGISTVFCGSGLVWIPIYAIAFFVAHYYGAAKRNYAPFAALVVSEALVTAAWCASVVAAGCGWNASAVFVMSFLLCGLKAALVMWLMRRAKTAVSPGAEPASA